MMATAELVEEVPLGTSKVVKVTGITNPGQTVSILVRGSNKLVLEEAERSLPVSYTHLTLPTKLEV